MVGISSLLRTKKEKMTFKKLISSTLKLNKINPVGVKVGKLKILPTGTNVLFTAKVKGTSGRIYITHIFFIKVKFTETDVKTKCKKYTLIKGSDGKFYCMKLPSYMRNDVTIRCSCEDFEFRWAFYNKKNNSLYGEPFPKYKRKTPLPHKGGRPFANPLKVPGMCKHIYTTFSMLVHNRLVSI